ncbi:uncharacterized protein O9250_010675 [Rhynochetos jubatus]
MLSWSRRRSVSLEETEEEICVETRPPASQTPGQSPAPRAAACPLLAGTASCSPQLHRARNSAPRLVPPYRGRARELLRRCRQSPPPSLRRFQANGSVRAATPATVGEASAVTGAGSRSRCWETSFSCRSWQRCRKRMKVTGKALLLSEEPRGLMVQRAVRLVRGLISFHSLR